MARPRSTRAESATAPTRRRRIRSSVSHCGAEGARACAHRRVRLNARLRAAILLLPGPTTFNKTELVMKKRICPLHKMLGL